MKPRREKNNVPSRKLSNALAAGLIFIAVGILLMLRNMGAIDPSLYRILVSWQMLLVVLGIWSMCRRHIVGGVMLAGAGVFFLIPKLAPAGIELSVNFWPFILILLGIMLLLSLARPSKRIRKARHTEQPTVSDGFVDVDNSFGSVRHIVLDPVFKGARIRSTMSGTVLDLKRTSLAEGETFIDVDMTFSGLEIIAPENWTIVVDRVGMTMAGVDDKRYHSAVADNTRKLVIRGSMALSGINIKS